MASIVSQDIASGRIGVLSWRHSTTHKEVGFAVTVVIANAHGGRAGEHGRQRLGVSLEPAAATIDVEPVLEQRRARRELIPAAGDIQVWQPVPVGIEEHRSPILVCLVGFPGLPLGGCDKAPVLALDEQHARHTGRTTDEHIVQAVSVHVSNGERGAVPGQHVRQQGLDTVVHERRRVMQVRQPMPCVQQLEQVLVRGRSRESVSPILLGGIGLFHDQEPIDVHTGQQLIPPIGPDHFEAVRARQRAEPKMQAVVDGGHIAPVR